MKWYCVKCKSKTDTINVRRVLTKNKKNLLVGTCADCGVRKATFVKYYGKGVVNDLLNSGMLPEMHLPGHNYTGPGTKVRQRLLRGDKPINQLDKAAQFHDLAYLAFKKPEERHIFDKKLQNEAWDIVKNKNASLRDKMEAGLVSGLMYGKRKLGLGVS